METKFMDRAAKIIEEVLARTCIAKSDTEVLEEILQDELKAYYAELEEYYIEEYHIALSSARNIAYDDGHSDGYAEGYDVGYFEGYEDGYAA